MPKTRSPNFPAIDLEKALGYVRKLYEKAQRHPMPISDVLKDVWDLSPTGSTGKQAVGAMRAFGLIDVDGSGKSRSAKISEDAFKILNDHSDKEGLIRAAALLPRVHKAVWDKLGGSQGLAPDQTIRQYLLFSHDPRFNEASIGAFISQFRATLSFAGVDGSVSMPASETDKNDTPEGEGAGCEINVGDWVQWTSGGIDQFPVPRKVARITEGYAFVEGASSGLPVGDLTIVDPPASQPLSPPAPGVVKELPGMSQNSLQLDEGNVILQYPTSISPESYEDLKDWLELMGRRVKRAVRTGEAAGGDPETA